MRTKWILLSLAAAAAALIPTGSLPTHRPVSAAQAPPASVQLPSYVLRAIRPGPVVPPSMTATILVPFEARLKEGAPPF